MTVVTKRPNTTGKNAGVLAGTTVHGDTSDSSLSTYVTGTGGTQNVYALVGMEDHTVAAGTRIRSVKLRMTNANNGAGGAEIQTGYIVLQDSADGARGTVFSFSRGTTTPVLYSGPVEFTAPGGKAWDSTTWNRIYTRIAFQKSQAGQYGRIFEIYADLDVNNQPTISSVSLNNATVTTRPDLSATYSDADGDLMTRARWRVFSAAQYGAVGFDPETSPATWDSGEVYGEQESITLTADLVNGTTYKAYAKFGHDWPGPQGDVWWSAWGSSAATTIAVSPPPTPTITVAQDLTLPSYRNRITISVDGVNVLDSPTASFEDGTVGFWQAGTNTGAPVASTTNPKSGTYAMQLTATAAGAVEAFSGGAATSRRVKPGRTYTALASFRGTTSRTVSVGIRWYDASGAVISTPMGSGVADTTTGYTQVSSGPLVAPANAFSAVVRVTGASLAAAEVLRVDEVLLAPGTPSTWNPGGYAQNGTFLVERALRVSPGVGRGPARNWLHPQIRSSGALSGTDGFYKRNAVDSVDVRQLDKPAPEAPADVTSLMIEWAIRTGSGSYLDVGAPDGVTTDGQHPYMFPAVPGQDHTYSVWLWASSAVSVRVGLYFTDAYNAALALPFSGVVALTTTPQKITVGGTGPAGTVYARAVIENNSGASNVSIFSTQPRFRLTSEPDEAWPGQVWAFVWDVVRGTPATLPADGTDLVVHDHEAPPGRPVMYRARLLATAPNGSQIASAGSTPVHVWMPYPARSVLKDPLQPENAAVVSVEPYWTETQSADETIYQPLGRGGDSLTVADPIKIRRWIGGQDADYTFNVLSDAELYRLRQLVPAAKPLLLQFFDGGQRYVIVGTDRSVGQVTTGTQESFKMNVKTIECGRP